MKLSVIRTLALSFGAIIAPVSVMAQSPIYATIPFDFQVGSTVLTSGDYRVKQLTPTILTFQNVNGKSSVAVLVNNSPGRAGAGKVKLMFNRYGARYFLSRVTRFDEGWEVPKSRSEKETIARMISAPQPELVAINGK